MYSICKTLIFGDSYLILIDLFVHYNHIVVSANINEIKIAAV